MHEIAEISPKACDELAQQIADTKPGLKVANKTASTVLNQLVRSEAGETHQEEKEHL